MNLFLERRRLLTESVKEAAVLRRCVFLSSSLTSLLSQLSSLVNNGCENVRFMASICHMHAVLPPIYHNDDEGHE